MDLLACNLDQGQPNFPATVLPQFLTERGVAHRIEYKDTYSVVTDKIAPGGTMCSLCSRLRRGTAVQNLPASVLDPADQAGLLACVGEIIDVEELEVTRSVPVSPRSWRVRRAVRSR